MEFSPQSYAPDGTAIFATDTQLLVKFYKHPQLSKFKSDEAGRPVYDDVEMISVIQPGEKEATVCLASEFHKRRFPKHYQMFRDGIEQEIHGTPLDHLFPSEPGTILTLKSFNVHTVDQLAALTDGAMGNLPMGRSLVDKAKAYLGAATGGAEFHAMQKQIDELKAQLSDREEAPAVERRGPGRPPKAQGES